MRQRDWKEVFDFALFIVLSCLISRWRHARQKDLPESLLSTQYSLKTAPRDFLLGHSDFNRTVIAFSIAMKFLWA